MEEPKLNTATKVYKDIPNIVEEKLSFGKVSARTRITSLNQLRKGDHVMEESPLGYWHHFIVEKVRPNYIWRIHKTGNPQTGKYSISVGDLTSKAQVVRNKFVLEPGMVVYRVEYPDEKDTPDGHGLTTVYPEDKVVRKARKRLGERNYNAIYRNCEHFCTECKTGKRISYQVYDFLWSILRLIFLILHGLVWGLVFIIATSTGFVAHTTILLSSHVIALVMGFLQDALAVAFLVIKADQAKNKGHVTPVDAERFKAKRVTPIVLGFVGYIVGAVLGFYHVPVPLIGSLLGAFLGHFTWQLLGLMFGTWIATIL